MLGVWLIAALSVHPQAPLEPAAGFRCRRALVTEGDRAYRVRKVCGAPTATRRRTELRPTADCGNAPCWIEVAVDEWVYDRGARKLVQYLTFENSVLVRIETRGH